MKFWKDIRVAILFVACIAIFSAESCTEIELHESHYPIKNSSWARSDTATGSFTIDDTTATYNISMAIRHRDKYAFNNIWLSLAISAPGDTLRTQKINIPLGTDATGWYGTGFNDIWEVRSALTAIPQRFRKLGTYTYKITQIMREDPLYYIMSVGMRVEKAQ